MPSDTMTVLTRMEKAGKPRGTQARRSHRDLLLSKTSLPLSTWLSSSLGSGLVIWYGLGGLGPRGRLSAENHLGCSKLAGKLPVLKRGCLPEEQNRGRSDCEETKLLSRRPRLDTGCSVTCEPEEGRMLLAWVHTFLLSNMLLAEAYGSGGCFWDNGHLYREDQPSPAPGLRCLNWLAAQGSRESLAEPSPGDHNYCRNPDRDPRGPWCYISSETGVPEKRPCEDVRCPETTSQAPLPSSTTAQEEKSGVPGDREAQVFPPANALPARSEAAEVQPVIGISQRVRTNSKEKKDLGTLGYVLAVTMMVIIIAIGVGIILGYTYKRGKDLKEQHEQKVCEREMQRITLPLSAFTNPTCEIVDEKTIIVHSNQTPADVQEGSTLLTGQAGTPGA